MNEKKLLMSVSSRCIVQPYITNEKPNGSIFFFLNLLLNQKSLTREDGGLIERKTSFKNTVAI